MKKTSEFINENVKWKILNSYILRIENFFEIDPSLAIENCKSLIESIFKTILVEIEEKTHDELKNMDFIFLNNETCRILGLNNKGYIKFLKNFSQTMAELRNKIGETSHGKDIYTLQETKDLLVSNEISFLVNLTDDISFFLLKQYSSTFPHLVKKRKEISYEDNKLFNDWFDSNESLLVIRDVELLPSEVLYENDIEAYKAYLSDYNMQEEN